MVTCPFRAMVVLYRVSAMIIVGIIFNDMIGVRDIVSTFIYL